MTAVCGICIQKAIEEQCYILMPGCGHIFDKACIQSSLGLNYTCPECNNNYLLPSPYRPIHLPSDRVEQTECRELQRRITEANCTAELLNIKLSRIVEELDVERRSRIKSNEALIATRKSLETLKSNYNNLECSKADCMSELTTPSTPKMKFDETSQESPQITTIHDDYKSKYAHLKNEHIGLQRAHLVLKHKYKELKSKASNETATKETTANKQVKAQTSQISSQNLKKKVCELKHIAEKAKERHTALQTNTNKLQASIKNTLSELNTSVLKAKNAQAAASGSRTCKSAKALNVQGEISTCMKSLEQSQKEVSTVDSRIKQNQQSITDILVMLQRKNKWGKANSLKNVQLEIEAFLATARQLRKKLTLYSVLVENAVKLNQKLVALIS